MQSVVITGGSHSGKTTLVSAIAELGYATVPEAALAVIGRLNASLGVSRQVAWRQAHVREFQLEIARLQAANESLIVATPSDVVFCDRGVHDGIAYCRAAGVEPPEELMRLAERVHYARVFVLETITPFSGRPETGRTSDEARSRRLGELIAETYATFGHEVKRVPAVPLQRRLDLVFEELGLSRTAVDARRDAGHHSDPPAA